MGLFCLALPSVAEQPAKPTPTFDITTLTDQLQSPWSLAFLPSGDILIAEKVGALRLFDGKTLSAPIAGVPQALVRSQGGFQDLVLHPDYEKNGWVYLSFAWGERSANGTRLVRGRIKQGAFVDQEVLFTAEPLKNTPVHYGARLAFLPDNTLVMAVGDGFDFRESAQKTDSLLGKFVRLNDDGSIPKDNPFFTKKDYHPAIYSLGHRNPQGVAYDPVRQQLFANEHGPQGGDEINILAPGKNYGWPIITYGRDYSGASITPFTEYEGMEQPLVNWTPSIAPSSLVVYNADLFPAFKGDLLSSALKAKEVRWVQMQGEKPVAEVSLFGELNARIRAVYVGSEGALYLLTDGDKGSLLKVTPTVKAP
ncbi:PQQ-dependent sugar dehydrogenase [Simiduia litorea]|uniref:PQQ-dependent sugar dehydrogenase n=1 Tax=Simiduia litorea TaxID=1435348 RepID=UPI0036F3FC42